MNPRLQRLFDLLENDRKVLSERLTLLTTEQFNHHAPGKWSINQIAGHLVTSERMTLQYLQKKILGVGAIKDSGLREEAKMVLLKISQRLPFRFKAPPFVVTQTPSYPSVLELFSDWNTNRAAWKDFLENVEDRNLKKMIYKHVVVGYMNVQHSLIFMREHVNHHLPQIDRLL